MLRIHDILVWIRIRFRIRGSMPLMDPDPAIFGIDLQDANKKLIKKKSFSAYYCFMVYLHHFSKIKKSKRSHKIVEIKVSLLFLSNNRRIRIRIQEVRKHVDQVGPDPVDPDPDPQHSLK